MFFFGQIRFDLDQLPSPAPRAAAQTLAQGKERKSEQAARLAERASFGGNAISCQITACKQVHPYFLTESSCLRYLYSTKFSFTILFHTF